MRILLAGQTYYPGNNGQAIFTIHLAEGLAQAGHEVHMVAPNNKFNYHVETINSVTVHYVRSVGFRWLHPEAHFTFLPAGQIQHVFDTCQPEIVHIQDHYFLCRDVVAIARRAGVPIIGTNHFLPENVLPYLNLLPLPRQTKIDILWRLMLETYNRLRAVTTPTKTAANILRGRNIRIPVFPVSCGVNTHCFHPNPGLDQAAARTVFGLDAEKVLFLYVGRQDREKRIDLLLRGLALLRKDGREDIQLAIAGQGAAQKYLQGLASTLELGQSVHFLGYIPDEMLPLLYQTADIFAMPSTEELQSIATLEAMASGKPVLAANARALPELITSGLNGWLFEPGRPDAVAHGMAELASSRDDWQGMGIVSRSRAVAHSLENTIKRYEALYHRFGRRHGLITGQPAGVRLSPVKMD